MSIDRERVLAAARAAGRNAAMDHAAGSRVSAPHVLAGSLLARQAASEWHRGFAEASPHAVDLGDDGDAAVAVKRAGDSGIPGRFPHQLAQWWERGEGAAKIRWGEGGDFDRCVRLAVEDAHMDPQRAKGFCAERHHAVLGIWPATHAKEEHASKARRSAVMASGPACDADGLDESWDGDHSDLPDMTGLEVAHLEAAEKAAGMTPPASGASRVSRMAGGARFRKLSASLAAKGAHDPDALAAWIGRRKYGKGTFTRLASAARKGAASRSATSELMRIYPLEDIHILTRAEGDGSGRVVEAYATVFDQAAEIHDHQGHYTEVIDRTAFDAVLARIARSAGGLAAQVKVLFNHGKTVGGAEAPEFQLPLGKPLDVRPEARGLLTRTEYDASDPFTERVLSKIHAGTITAQSFVGGIIRSSPELKGPGDRYRARNGTLTTVRRMQLGLREYGPVLFPAYTGAEILGVRMQLPGAPDDAPDYTEDEEYSPGMEGDVAGGTPEEVHPSRLNAHRLWQLRNEELCREAGIVLPGRG